MAASDVPSFNKTQFSTQERLGRFGAEMVWRISPINHMSAILKQIYTWNKNLFIYIIWQTMQAPDGTSVTRYFKLAPGDLVNWY